ncbi:hypothetical protein D3C76_1745070 [compost metagenome]
MHPAAAQRFGRGLWLVPVTEHDARPTHKDFTDGAAGHFAVLGIDDANFHAVDWLPGRIHLAAALMLFAVVLGA